MGSAATFSESVDAVTAYLEVVGTDAIDPTVFSLHDEVVIGREPQDSLASGRYLCIPEHTISRRHARIKRRGDTYYVEDLDSFNGTTVHGTPVSGRRQVGFPGTQKTHRPEYGDSLKPRRAGKRN